MSIVQNQLEKDGAPFYPRGFNMIGVLTPDNCTSAPGAGKAARNAFGATELTKARDGWHANTIRLQVSQSGLDPMDPNYSAAYVNRVVAGISLGRSLGFVVIASMQDQSIGCGKAHVLPTAATLRSWSTLAPLVDSDLGVMFELFNEPVNAEQPADWQQWRDGGTTPITSAENQGDAPVGHQDIVATIRGLGAKNVLIGDGANHAGKLQNLYPNYVLTDTLSPSQIMYAVHPYYFNVSMDLSADQANWDMRFGYLTAHVALIATEWNASASCAAGQAQRIPQFFDYLFAHQIGLLGHAFDYPNTMVQDLATFAPTEFTGCVAGSDAGHLVQDRFTALAM